MSFWSTLLRKPPQLPGDRTAEILNRHLTGDFRVYPLAEEPITAEHVLGLGRRLEIMIPPEVVAHLTGRFPGVYVEAKEEVWPRPNHYDVGPFWSFLYGVHTFTASTDSEDWMRMDLAAAELRKTASIIAVPVLKVVGDANVYCVRQDGTLASYDHELGVLDAIDGGFFDLLDREIGELRARTEKKKSMLAGGGTA